MRVLSFSPHPDDTEAYCGGTLAKYAAMGHAVGIVTMTRGDVGSPTLSRDEIAAVREQEARNAAALIGAELFWLGYDDEFLYDTPEVRRRVIDVLREFRPDVVLCPDKDRDYHPDHVRTGQIVWDTHVMGPIKNIPTAHAPTEFVHEIWYYDTAAGIDFMPEFYVDISDFWETKKQMIECHVSQDEWCRHMYGIPVSYFGETQSRFRGYQAGCRFAEGFRRSRTFPYAIDKDALLPTRLAMRRP